MERLLYLNPQDKLYIQKKDILKVLIEEYMPLGEKQSKEIIDHLKVKLPEIKKEIEFRKKKKIFQFWKWGHKYQPKTFKLQYFGEDEEVAEKKP